MITQPAGYYLSWSACPIVYLTLRLSGFKLRLKGANSKTKSESGSIYLVVISSKCIIKTNYTTHNVPRERFNVPEAFAIFMAPP